MATSTDAKKLKHYIAQRQVECSKIATLKTIADQALLDDTLHSVFACRFRHIESIRENFEKHNNAIIALLSSQDNSDITPHLKELEAFDHKYFHCEVVYN